MKVKRRAFTLAEVLITLGIIGVVSAITIPGLITNARKKITLNKLKKTYSEITQAVKLSEYENGEMSGWDYTLPADKFLNTYFNPYIKIGKSNANVTNQKAHYKFPNGKNFNLAILTSSGSANFTTMNGSIIIVDSWYDPTQERRGIAVDINGLERPNIRGIDVFEFWITKSNGVQPKGYDIPLEDIQNPFKQYSCSDSMNSEAYSCTAWIIKSGWQIPRNYPWK